MLITSKQALIIGGNNDIIGSFDINKGSLYNNTTINIANELINSLKKTWKITCINYTPNPLAHQNIALSPEENLDEKYKEIISEIQKSKVRFDSIFCFSNEISPKIQRISDPKIFSFEEDAKNSINLMLLGTFFSIIIVYFEEGAKLATEFIQSNGFLLLSGIDQSLLNSSKTEMLLSTQNHFLSLSVSHRNEDEIPVDATITTFFRGNHDQEVEKTIAELFKKWAEGKGRPHDGAYFTIKTRDLSSTNRFLLKWKKNKFEIYPEYL